MNRRVRSDVIGLQDAGTEHHGNRRMAHGRSKESGRQSKRPQLSANYENRSIHGQHRRQGGLRRSYSPKPRLNKRIQRGRERHPPVIDQTGRRTPPAFPKEPQQIHCTALRDSGALRGAIYRLAQGQPMDSGLRQAATGIADDGISHAVRRHHLTQLTARRRSAGRVIRRRSAFRPPGRPRQSHT